MEKNREPRLRARQDMDMWSEAKVASGHIDGEGRDLINQAGDQKPVIHLERDEMGSLPYTI